MSLPEFDPEDDLDFLDEIDGLPTVEELCAEARVTHVEINPVRAGLLATMKVSGITEIDGAPHNLSVWVGLASGRPSTATNPKTWLEMDGNVIGNIDYGGFRFTEDLPDSTMHPIMLAGAALERICYAANNDLADSVEDAIDEVKADMNALALSTWPRTKPLREAGQAQHPGLPHIETPLSTALDLYVGLCAVGDVSHLKLDHVIDGPLLGMRLSGDSHWDGAEHPLELWTGRRDGSPGSVAERTTAWLKVEDKILDLSRPLNLGSIRGVSAESVPDLAAAINQLVALMNAASEALYCIDTPEDMAVVLHELARLSGGAKSIRELSGSLDEARRDLLRNYSMNLLGGITITEAEAPHLSFDVAAVTVDPVTTETMKLRVGWIPSEPNSMQFTHSYQIEGTACLAHDEADVDRLMATVPDESREHYLHVFDHLHQIAHAMADYAEAAAGEAIALASTCNRPLNAYERHDLTHEIHKGALVAMNPVAWSISGEPDLPTHES